MNKQRLFTASCFALITTAFAFAIRAGIMTQIQDQLTLSGEQLGVINLMAFLGFPVATIVGGILYNVIGAKRMVWIAFLCHLVGILTTIFAGDFLTLLFSNFFIGFANGTVEQHSIHLLRICIKTIKPPCSTGFMCGFRAAYF